MPAAKTVVSGSSYCTPTQFGQRYDVRSLAQRLSDDGTDVSDPLNDTKLAAILKEASGKVEAAALVGERYTPTDLAELQELVNGATTNMCEMLAGLVADLAIPIIFKRRPEILPQFPQVQEAQLFLKALAEGEKIFGFQETMDAGHMDSEYEEPATIANRNLFSYQARRFFGTRGNMMPRP